MKPRAADWLSILGLVLIISIFDGPLLGSRIPRGEDHWLAFIPAYSVGEGCWPPRWNPFVCGGAPCAANPQYSPWYPPRWVFGLTTALAAYGPYCFGHFLVAALAMFICLRSLGCASTGATIGALSFACGSYIQGHLSNPGLLFSSVWLPLVVALSFQAMGREGLKWPTWLGLLMAVVVFAGSPHNMFYAALIVGLITVWQMCGAGIPLAKSHGQAGRAMVRIVGRLGLAATVGLGVSAVQWIPTAEFVRLSQRHILSVNELARDPLAWSWLGSLFVGSPAPWPTEYLDKSTYFGMSALPLLLLAIVTPRRKRPDETALLPGREWFFVVLALIGVWIALGTQAGAFQLLARVPVARWLSGPSRALVLFAVGTSVLVGLGADRFLREEDWKKRRPFRFVLFASAALAAVLFLAKCRHLSWHDIADIALRATTPRDASLFLAANGAAFLAFGAALVAAAAFPPPRFSGKRWFGPAMALLLCLDLFHFRLRLPLPMSPREDLDRPATVSFVSGDRSRPFRIVGYEPTRVNPGDMNDQSLRPLVMPNLAALYRLQDIQGFDPVMLRDYVRLVEATAGRSPIDDPARMLNVARPDPTLFRLLNVRYVIGDVRERRIGSWPPARNGICTLRLDEPTTLAGVSLVSLLDGAEDVADDTTVALATALGDALTSGKMAVLPTGARAAIRAGVETADWRAADARFPCRHRAGRENMAWTVTAPFGPVRVANYYAQVSFPEPIVARAIEIRQTAPGIVLSVATVAAVLPESPRWEKVFERDRYRVYRNRDVFGGAWLVHRVRAVADEDEALGLLAKGKVDIAREALVAGTNTRDILPPSSDAAGTSAGLVEFVRYEPDRIEVRTESSRPALLCFAEVFYPGWAAQVDGHPAELIRVNFLLRGVAIPTAGGHTVTLRFAPRSLTIGMVISAIAFLAAVGLLLAASKSVVSGFKREPLAPLRATQKGMKST